MAYEHGPLNLLWNMGYWGCYYILLTPCINAAVTTFLCWVLTSIEDAFYYTTVSVNDFQEGT